MEQLLRRTSTCKRISALHILHSRNIINASLSLSNELLNKPKGQHWFNYHLHLVSRKYHTNNEFQRRSSHYKRASIPSPNSTRRTHKIQKRSKVFVSSYNQLNITAADVQTFCEQHGIPSNEMKTTPTHVQLKECPFCSKPTNGKQDNFYKLHVHIGNGMYYCFRCGAKGSWFDFKRDLGGFQVVSPNTLHASPSTSSQAAGEDLKRSLPIPGRKQNALYIANLSRPENEGVKSYMLKKRGLKLETLRTYGVGVSNYKFKGDDDKWVDSACVTFPWICRVSEIQEQEELRGGTFHWKEGGAPVEQQGLITLDEADGKSIKKASRIWMDSYNKLKAYKQLVGHCRVPHPYEQDMKLGRWVKNQITQHRLLINGKPSSLGPHHVQLLDEVGVDWPAKAATAASATPSLAGDNDAWITRRIKARSLHNKGWQRLEPKGGGWGLFGWHTIPADAKEIIITEGEYDAMAVYQATKRPAISLPNGCRSLPMEVLPMLERFEKIYLWMDMDGPGQEGAKLFASKLGISRCYIVKPTENTPKGYIPKDANDALLKNVNLEEMILNARVTPHERVISLEDIMPDVLHELRNPDEYTGDPVTSLPNLTNIIKGFRRGELTVFSGATGSGKTTFLCQVSLDFARQNINTLWGSFEIKNSRLIHKIFHQHLQKPLPAGKLDNNPEANKALDYLSSQFAELPLYFMTFHGASDVDDVLNAMDYSVYVHDVKHIFLDNLQFMLSRNKGGSWDKFDAQDQALEKFRKFASERNVHITLVVHPRKEEEGVKLGMNSIYGSAKATQEADTVMILQTDGGKKYVEVKKNRYDGALGSCSLYFQKESCRYLDRPVHGIDASKFI